MKKPLITTLVFFLFYTLSFSQTRETLEVNKSYELAKIYLKNHQITRGRNLTLINDSTISFKNNTTLKVETVSLNNLNSIKVKSGTRVAGFALYGAGLMALSSLLAVADIESDPYTELKPNAGAIIAGFIGGGAIIGGLVGLATPKWKSISIPRKTQGNASFYLNPVIDINRSYFALSFKIKL
ncbi:MAG: hypothetical protein MUO72_00645 [Bacteroidales bacterium]|nr:hypothetical protein [Bacteroidales bacterium]